MRRWHAIIASTSTFDMPCLNKKDLGKPEMLNVDYGSIVTTSQQMI